MCAPVVPLIAAGLGAIGSGISMASSIGQARAQAAAADANAQAESNAAQIGQQNMRDGHTAGVFAPDCRALQPARSQCRGQRAAVYRRPGRHPERGLLGPGSNPETSQYIKE